MGSRSAYVCRVVEGDLASWRYRPVGDDDAVFGPYRTRQAAVDAALAAGFTRVLSVRGLLLAERSS